MSNFIWVRNPTAINGLATTYVSKRGSDTTGDGTAQNPYASIAFVTNVTTAGTNIMLDDGTWEDERISNNKAFKWWGNANTERRRVGNQVYYFYNNDELNFLTLSYGTIATPLYSKLILNNVVVKDIDAFIKNAEFADLILVKNTIFINCTLLGNNSVLNVDMENCVIINSNVAFNTPFRDSKITNCVFFNSTVRAPRSKNVDYNNYTNTPIPTENNSNSHSINDTITGQTFVDYFNNYDANDFTKCDFTAKAGSANIGRGAKGGTIGLNQGYTMYADNSANDVFKESNGATLKNIAWDSNLNGYTLVQKERVCQGATSNTITLDSSASAVDDYYNNLFIGIVGGDGYGELFLITDYDGATKTATIDGTWNTTPTTNSIYTISGTILSATKDLGKVINVKRNWTFADNFTALTDGQWAEFMTHVGTNGKQFPVSCYSYEYSIDGVNFIQGQTADDLVSAINGENKVTDAIYGDCSVNYDVSTAKNLIMRYIRVRVNIGFSIGQLGE